jgi:hypothetical protein
MGEVLYRWAWDYVDFFFHIFFDGSTLALIALAAALIAGILVAIWRVRWN